MRLIRAISLAALLAFGAAPALAQWQVPNNSTPLGRGGGSSGFKSVGPCATGEILTGVTAGPPVCTPIASISVRTVDNLAALKALPVPSTDGQVVFIRGWSTGDDGGQGFFIWNSTSAIEGDDGVVVVVTANGVANGRFIREGVFTLAAGASPRHTGTVETAWFGDVPSALDADRQTRIQLALDRWSEVQLRPGEIYNITSIATSYGASIRATLWMSKSDSKLDCRGATIRRPSGDLSPGNPPTQTRSLLYIKSPTAATFIENIIVVNCNFDGNNTGNTGIGVSSPGDIQDNNIVLSYVRNWLFRTTTTNNSIASGFAAAASDGGSLIDTIADDNGKDGVYLSDDGAGGLAISRRVLINNLRGNGNNANFGQSGGSYFSAACIAPATKCNYTVLAITTDSVLVDGLYGSDNGTGAIVTAVGSPLDNNINFSLNNFLLENSGGEGLVIATTGPVSDGANFSKNINISNGIINTTGISYPGLHIIGVRKANVSNVTINGARASGLYLDMSTGTQRTITGITKANPGVVTTSAAHGYQTGDRILFTGVAGMIEVNNLAYTITVVSPTTFSIVDTSGGGFTPYTSGGTTTPILLSRDINIANVTVADSTTNGVSMRATEGVNFSGLILRNNGGWGLQTISDGSGTAANTSIGFGKIQFINNVSGTADLTASSSTGTTTCSNQFIHSISAFGIGSCGSVSLTAAVSGILPPANGGTGVANNAASTLTISGAFATTLTVSNTTTLTLPVTGTLATLAGVETFTNKYITRPIGQGGVVVPTTGSGAGGCGTGPALSGNDSVGIITLGTTPNATTCTITFSTAWLGSVVCAVSNISTGTATYMSASNTTSFTMTGTFAAGHNLSWICRGRA